MDDIHKSVDNLWVARAMQLHDKLRSDSFKRDFGAYTPQSTDMGISFNFSRLLERRFVPYALGMLYPISEQSQEQIQEDLVLLHGIYPNLNRQQLLEAKENLDRYFNLAIRIFLRLERDNAARQLDRAEENSYDPDTKVDSPTHH